MNDAAIVPLGNLRLIRGQSLYEGEFALIVMSNYKPHLTSALNYTGLQQLQLSNLSGEAHAHTHTPHTHTHTTDPRAPCIHTKHAVFSNDAFCIICHQKSSGEGWRLPKILCCATLRRSSGGTSWTTPAIPGWFSRWIPSLIHVYKQWQVTQMKGNSCSWKPDLYCNTVYQYFCNLAYLAVSKS